MMRTLRYMQSQQISQLNQLRALQQQVAYWEQNPDNYNKAVEVFKEYVDFIKTLDNPRALVNSYIRMGQYCERMGDRLFATDLYREALMMEEMMRVDPIHINNLRTKIQNLSWF